MSGSVMEREADVVVVGGGIVGCAAAYYLVRRGVRVVLVERGTALGDQSRRNWGFVRQQGRDPLEVPLMMEANRMWRGLERELGADIEWVQGGNLALAADEERMGLFEQWLGTARQFGLDTRLVSARELSAIVPRLEGSWVGGMYTGSDGHAEPGKATDAFGRAAATHGARIYTGCAVEAIDVRAGEVSAVITERGEIRTTRVVCAAGAWSGRLARCVGVSLPQRRVRGTVARTTAGPPVTAAGVWGPTLSFRQRRDGSVNIAAGGAADYDITLDALRHLRFFLPNYWRNRRLFRFHLGRPFLRDLAGLAPWTAAHRHPFAFDRGIEPPPNSAKVERSLAELHRLLPALADLRVAQTWAGYIDATPDAVPVLGQATRPRGLVFATGFSGHGFAMGPIAGRLVGELIVDGKTSLDIRGFRLSRFAEGAHGRPRSVL